MPSLPMVVHNSSTLHPFRTYFETLIGHHEKTKEGYVTSPLIVEETHNLGPSMHMQFRAHVLESQLYIFLVVWSKISICLNTEKDVLA